jgi:hypothetical protein
MIDLSKVFKVYNGKANACACGCSGKYKIASSLKSVADKDRGYSHDESDIDDTQVRKIVGKILSSDNPIDNGDHVYAVVGKRMYVAFKMA